MLSLCFVSARANYDGTSGFELAGGTNAFSGFGAVARAVFKLSQAFGLQASADDPYIPKDAIKAAGADPVDTVAELFKSQSASLHVPLTPETEDSITMALLSSMSKSGTLINTSRQEVVLNADLQSMHAELRRQIFQKCSAILAVQLRKLHKQLRNRELEDNFDLHKWLRELEKYCEYIGKLQLRIFELVKKFVISLPLRIGIAQRRTWTMSLQRSLTTRSSSISGA